MPERGRPPSVAGKVMAILDAFALGGVRLNLSEICRRSGLPPATGHRLVGELVAGGFLERVPDGTYRIGTRLWRIGSQAPAVAPSPTPARCAGAWSRSGATGSR